MSAYLFDLANHLQTRERLIDPVRKIVHDLAVIETEIQEAQDVLRTKKAMKALYLSTVQQPLRDTLAPPIKESGQ